MQNRRDFFKSVAGATAGAYIAGRGLPALAQRGGGGQRGGGAAAPTGPVKRREVSIGRKRVRVIDVHSHCTVEGVAEVVKGTPFERQAGGRALGPDRIALIDGQGIDIQVLTINGYWWWEVQDQALAGRIVRAQNEGLAKWVGDHSDRFVALASISLQFPELAAEQLDYGVKRRDARRDDRRHERRAYTGESTVGAKRTSSADYSARAGPKHRQPDAGRRGATRKHHATDGEQPTSSRG